MEKGHTSFYIIRDMRSFSIRRQRGTVSIHNIETQSDTIIRSKKAFLKIINSLMCWLTRGVRIENKCVC